MKLIVRMQMSFPERKRERETEARSGELFALHLPTLLHAVLSLMTHFFCWVAS